MKLLEIFPGRNWRVSAGLGLALFVGVAGCHKTATAAAQGPTGADPADANLAPAGTVGTEPVLAQNVQNEAVTQAQDYSQQQPAPIERRAPSAQPQDQSATQQQQYDEPQGEAGSYDAGDGSLTDDQAADVLAADLTDESAVDAPPPLPDGYDDQPVAPGPDYLWTPGYWGYTPAGYFWVPGVWVSAPFVGALWTPGYWGFVGGAYRFHHGYWGPHIGFYGGINYGCGYVGTGFYGGYWNGGHFFYNTVVTRVGPGVRTVYSHPLAAVRGPARVSFWGGRGGIAARPTGREVAVMHERRIPAMQAQMAVRHDAMANHAQFYNVNHGRPAMAVSTHPVKADHTLPAPLARPNIRPAGAAGGFRGTAARPGGGPVTSRPGGGTAPVARPGPQAGPERGTTPMHENNRAAPQAAHPQQQPMQRPQQQQPQNREEYGGRPQQQQQQQSPRHNGGQEQRPQPQQQARPQPQMRQEPQQPRPQQQMQQPRPQPEMRQAPASRPQPQPQHEAPRGEERR